MKNSLEKINSERIKSAAILEREESAGLWISDAPTDLDHFAAGVDQSSRKKPKKVRVIQRTECFKRNLMTVAIKLYKNNQKLN